MNAPLNPVMGSALFLLSYVRPIKYWEKNYKYVMLIDANMIDIHLWDSVQHNYPYGLFCFFFFKFSMTSKGRATLALTCHILLPVTDSPIFDV